MRKLAIGCGVIAVCVTGIVGTGVGSRRLAAQENGAAGVTLEDLRQGYKNPTRWLSFSGDYSGQRHSPLKEITPDNVNRLAACLLYTF
jgi:glucose dehydrogenase